MKRIPFFYPRVLDNRDDAYFFAKRSAYRAQRLGTIYADMLRKDGLNQGRILDIGSGGGDMLIEIAKNLPGIEGVGLDLAEPIHEIAREKALREDVAGRVSFIKGDVQAMPFDADEFDVVVSLNTLHVVDDPASVFDETERVLKPEGRFALSDIKRSWRGAFMRMLATGYTAVEVKEFIARSRFGNWKLIEKSMWFVVLAGGWVNF